MAIFQAKRIEASQINGGFRYENGDVVEPSAINSPIEASMYAQSRSDEAIEISKMAVGTGNFEIISGYMKLMYPVGSIYISTENNSPASWATMSGTVWERIENVFLLGASENYPSGTMGGSANAVLVSHTHTVMGAVAGGYYELTMYGTNALGVDETGAYSQIHKVSTEGTDGTGKNMPPYISVYMWRRVS